MTFTVPPPSDATQRSTGRLLGPKALARALRDLFGIEVAQQRVLGGETDQNVRVDTTEGTTWFARITAAPGDEIDWQNQLLQHLAETVPEVPAPRLRPTLDGRLVGTIVDDAGAELALRVMTWLPGRTLAEVSHHPAALLRRLGTVAGRIGASLASMPAHEAGTHDWDLRRVTEVVTAALPAVEDPTNVANIRTALAWYARISDDLADLPHSVVHHDLNDANILIDVDAAGELQISGVVDVGDALHSARVTEVAIAAAYAMVRKTDPLAAATEVVAGFHEVVALTGRELAAVYPLALARLCMNAATWSLRVRNSGTEYGRSRMRYTWPTIARLMQVHPAVAEERFRIACGLPAAGGVAELAELVARATPRDRPWADAVELDVRPDSDLFDDLDWTRPADLTARIAATGNGRVRHLPHLRASLLRAAPRRPGLDDPSTVQLGTGVLLPAGTSVAVPVTGVIERSAQPLVVRHRADGLAFRTTWWGISDSPAAGTVLEVGDHLGVVADPERADPDHQDAALLTSGVGIGGIQVVVVADADLATRLPRFIRPGERAEWQRLAPDPAPLLGLSADAAAQPTIDSVLAARRRHIASSQRNYYREPMNLVRGRDVWFYDEDAHAYLDSLNNVTHVGHAEPRVNAAATRQMRKLNTNSRFVYPQIASYTEKLVATLPDALEVVFLVCTGSEANDLALRIARQVTGRTHVVNIDGAYHGNTGWVTGVSPNRYKGPGGDGAPPTTHEVTTPDRYRGRFGYDDPDAGREYAALAKSVIDRIAGDGRAPAAFIAESLMGSAGNIVHPQGYLAGTFAAARAVGALCIADEVQVGVGRLGPWWGFELQGVVPDIVTMGKPLGNGHPLAAVVTTRAIADAFDTGMKYFNTFGGNPVSCAIGEAVLDVVDSDGLRANAVDIGMYFAAQLRQLQDRQPLIGDVRSEGLYLGVELVRDRATKEPAKDEAFAVTELTKERGVVVFPNGVHDNVLKIKPPMTFRRDHVDRYVETLDDVLTILDSISRDRGQERS